MAEKGPRMKRIMGILAILLVGTASFAVGQTIPPASPSGLLSEESNLSPRVFPMGAPPTSATLQLLREVESRHGNLKTLQAEFSQEKTSAAFEEQIKSEGNLQLQMPDKLRAFYKDPDESTVWFVNNTLYQVTPALKQVDKYAYKTAEEAKQQFRLMMLGFGMSSKEILDNYEVTSEETLESKTNKKSNILMFRPLDPEISRTYKEFRVWLSDDRLPTRVRYEESSGDVTVLTIRKLVKDDPIRARVFEPAYPEDFDVIEH